jgi:hypothetical protein
MSLTKLSLDGNNLIITVQREFGKFHPGWGWEMANFFLQCIHVVDDGDAWARSLVINY